MYRISILLFAIAALAGLTMAVMHFKKASPPRPVLAVLHGLFAASGLVILLLAVTKVGMHGAPAIALGLLVLAALGGFGLLSFHLRGRALPWDSWLDTHCSRSQGSSRCSRLNSC